jgi:hypothetical protein
MKLSLLTVLAALSLSLLACDEKKEGAAKPANTIVTSVTAAPAGASAKPAGTGAGW